MTKLFNALFALSSIAMTSTSLADDILLITADELKEAWQPYAQWQLKSNKKVTIITTDEIANRYSGPDIQEKMRLCVREHIDTKNTHWIILGGDSLPQSNVEKTTSKNGGIVPDRDTVHINMWGKKTDIPTDIYYISPTNWDADSDGIYGEFKDDYDAITYPDGSVGLGRIPVRTPADVAAYTAKVISYESNYPKGDYGNSMTYTCTVPSAIPKLLTSWEDHVSNVMPDAKLMRYFTTKAPWDDQVLGERLPSPNNLTSLINSKSVGKFHIHGHGLLHCWVLDKHQEFTKNQVSKLTNKGAYPIITTVSCLTGYFDAKQDPCIVESMLRTPEAGAIAVVAPAREGKPHFLNPKLDFQLMTQYGKMDGTTETMTRFWEYGIGENLTTGQALMYTKASLVNKAKISPNFHMCLCEINLLGDPTILVNQQSTSE